MYNFIKNLLNPKKPEPLIIAFSAIPAWTDEKEKTARTALEDTARDPMQNIRNSAAQLQHIVNSISGSEQDPALHPKLRAVAKNSLPLYVKAMNASLAKPLSEDIEEFYTDAVECLKSCINSNRGRGRYLQAVFPDEMKAVKIAIDGMGKELNVLTSALATYRKQEGAVEAVRTLFQSVKDMQGDLERSGEKERRIMARIDEMTTRIAAIGREEAALAADVEGNRAVNECRSVLAEKEKNRNEVTRNYAARSMTASHVFRKAEKIAGKQHLSGGEVAALRQAIEILSDHDLPDALVLKTALTAACPVAQRMIAAGDIPLKNREEREIFSDTDAFCTLMAALCAELSACDEACRLAETAVAAHAMVVRANSLAREKTQLNSMLEKEQQVLSELVEWKARTIEKIPAVTEEIRKNIEGIMGVDVQFQADANTPV